MSINFNKKKILVVGLGDTGQSVLHFLANKECDIQAIDTRLAIDNFDEIKEITGAAVAKSQKLKLKVAGHRKASYEAIFNVLALAQANGWDPVLAYDK